MYALTRLIVARATESDRLYDHVLSSDAATRIPNGDVPVPKARGPPDTCRRQ